MIRDITTFAKLFRLPIPYPKEQAYYLETLSRSPRYGELPRQIEAFCQLEERLRGQAVDVAQHRRQAVDALVEHLAQAQAFARLRDQAAPQRKLTRRDHRGQYPERTLLSLDMQQANYHTLKRFDDEGAMAASWSALLARLDIEPLFAESKPLRQLVFGRLEPKHNQTLQAHAMHRLVELLRDHALAADDEIVLLQHDEIMIAPPEDEAVARAQALASFLEDEPLEGHPLRLTASRYTHLERGHYLQTHLQLSSTPIVELGRSLFKVPGNLFYLYFKRHVLEEPLDPRDSFFLHEGRLAMWLDHDAAIDIKKLYGPQTMNSET